MWVPWPDLYELSSPQLQQIFSDPDIKFKNKANISKFT